MPLQAICDWRVTCECRECGATVELYRLTEWEVRGELTKRDWTVLSRCDGTDPSYWGPSHYKKEKG